VQRLSASLIQGRSFKASVHSSVASRWTECPQWVESGHLVDAPKTNCSDALEEKAEATREAGDAKEEAIDNSDVDTDDITPAQQNAMVNAQ
jgi:hypothetical protein